VTTPEAADPTDPAADIRGVRRIFLVALAAAVVAAAIALGFELSHQPASTPSVSTPTLPLTFRQPGFVDHAVRRGETASFRVGQRHGVLSVPPTSGPVYVVVRCDVGRVTVATSVLTSAQPCTGKPVGVVALGSLRQPTRLDVTVSRPQHSSWAVAVYR
jgi:hypothetical protein